uniref:Rel homology dimerisation domain-containing protein n=1 Tax=Ditylenchus dipsaci TaxID=166011 RepID=A0A915EGK2_9BILA
MGVKFARVVCSKKLVRDLHVYTFVVVEDEVQAEAGNNDYDDWLAPVWQPPITPCTSVSLPLSHPQLQKWIVSLHYSAKWLLSPTRVELYASSGAGPMTPHPLYQLIPVSGKSSNTTPCQKVTAADGIECLEVILRPETSMTAVLDCMGLLKICSYDAKHKRNIKTSSKNAHLNTSNYGSAVDFNAITMAQNSVRIVMRAYILWKTLVQQLGVPEVLKMSLTGASAKGEAELFIIGRNFDRNTKVVFREYKEDGTLGWSAEAYIDKHYLHQCHIVCTVPAYYNLFKGGTVSVTVICASKSSHPKTFVYTPSEVEEEEDDWRPPGSPHISAVDSFDFGSVYNEANSTQNQQLVKTAN